MKKQIIRFLIVGGTSTVINYFIFYCLLNFFSVRYTFSSAIGYICGIFVGYFFNKNWTFESVSKSKLEVVKYYFTYLITLGISIVALKFQVDFLKIDAKFANLIVILITTILNFLGTRYLVFYKTISNK